MFHCQIRRTYYGLTKSSPISNAQLKSIVETAVTHAPSPFNIQSGRAVLLTGKSSDKLWDIVKAGFLKTLGGDGMYLTKFLYMSVIWMVFTEASIKLYTTKIEEYAAGYGTVLFFEDNAVIEGISAKMPPYVYLQVSLSTPVY